jgi:hypothetical protein
MIIFYHEMYVDSDTGEILDIAFEKDKFNSPANIAQRRAKVKADMKKAIAESPPAWVDPNETKWNFDL